MRKVREVFEAWLLGYNSCWEVYAPCYSCCLLQKAFGESEMRP